MPKKKKWDEDQLRSAAKKAFSIRQVIFELGLVPAGGNYVHVQRYLNDLNIDTSHFTGKGWNKGLHTGKPHIALEDILVQKSTYQSHK
ncbi:MAG: hypothetical protein KW788_02785 [Candidatus Doudnabacteria bacterium]|nr:hypothetical protein [Candidatus Doudnabacteria bacterium]